MRPPTPALCFACLLVAPVAARAAQDAAPCADASEPTCADAEARRLLAAGQPREAIALLKASRSRFPGAQSLALLLAKAYLASGNHFWALRTLRGWLAGHPEDCAGRSWMAWVLARQGFLDQADEALDLAPCEATAPSAARWAVLRALVARYREDREAVRAAVDHARTLPEAWPDDLAALEALLPQVDPAYGPPVRTRLALDLGWTSNARAGAPSDPKVTGDHASPMGLLQAALEARWPTGAAVEPTLELRLWGLGYAAEQERDFSYLLASLRPGLDLARVVPARLAYRFDAFGLAGGDEHADGAFLYYSAHRGELDLELSRSFQLLLGAGRRTVRQRGRSRLEADALAIVDLPTLGPIRPAATLQGRWHDARAFDRLGATGLLSGLLPLGGDRSLRLSVLGSHDRYSESTAYFQTSEDRRDTMLRGVLSLWLVRLGALRLGASAEVARRWSTVTRYAYPRDDAPLPVDSRLVLKLSWMQAADPWLPAVRAEAGHVPLGYGLTRDDAADEDSVRELLRQDEAAISGSACVE